jgi:alkylhydroperoxidase/carboxymuconolactone decarboxylase family protein YurZ
MATKGKTAKPSTTDAPMGPWDLGLAKLLHEWDPKGAELLMRVGTNPWTSGVLPRKEVELISLALYCSCTTLDETGTRRQIRASLDAGATRDEILLILKCCVGLAVHSCSLGAPILLEEMRAAGVKPASGPRPETPASDAMRAMGQWNTAWDPFYELSPAWTDQFFAFGASIYKSPLFTPRFIELISIALDASVTHMYEPGTRRHIKTALQVGATPEEIMTTLQICVSMGVQACAMGVPILAEELEHRSRNRQ